MAKTDLRLAILGAGPIGLEAALYAQALKMPFTLYERGRVAEYVQRWGHVKLFTPFGQNVTPLGRKAIQAVKPGGHTFPADDAILTGRDTHAAYWGPAGDALQQNLQLETAVLQIGRKGYLKDEGQDDPKRAKSPFRLLLRDKKGERVEEADVVLDCTGTYGQHRWLGEGGVPALGELAVEAQIVYGLDDILGEKKNQYANKTTLIVGGGYCAATTAAAIGQLGLEQNTTWAVWVARCSGSNPLKRIANDPYKERDRLASRANNLATRRDDNVDFHGQCIVESIESLGQDKGYKVNVRQAGKLRTFEADRIVANVGYSPDRNLYRELNVVECSRTLKPTSEEPGFYILGAKTQGRGGEFFLPQGFEQVRSTFASITGDKNLNLHKAQ